MTQHHDPPAFDYFAAWWRGKQRSEMVLAQYLREVRALEAAGYPLPPDLDLDEARRYIAQRQAMPNQRTGAPISIERIKIVIRAIKSYSEWSALHHEEPDKLGSLEHPRSPQPVGGKIASRDEYERLMKSLNSAMGFAATRDKAMLGRLWVTGMRRSDLLRLTVEDIADHNTVALIRKSKNGAGRTVSLRTKRDDAVVHLDRYLRHRKNHTFASLPNLWLGERGGLSADGFSSSLERRCKTAGVEVRSHQFRRSLASRWLQSGTSQLLLMETCGWSSNETLKRYVKQDVARLALDAARNLNL